MSWLSPYTVSIPEDRLDDLRARLARTRWIDDFPETAWDLGVSCVYLQELCEYWRTTFDWRAQESLLNSYSQYMVDVDGQSIHFVHARSARRDALPLLLIHGWPGSVFEYIKVLDPLSPRVVWRGRSRLVPRRHAVDSRLRVLRADTPAGLGSGEDRVGVRHIDAPPRL